MIVSGFHCRKTKKSTSSKIASLCEISDQFWYASSQE